MERLIKNIIDYLYDNYVFKVIEEEEKDNFGYLVKTKMFFLDKKEDING